MKLKLLVTTAALSIVIVHPALAYRGYGAEDRYTRAFRGPHYLSAQDALYFGHTDIYPRYYSGWGGLYGDGNYPGSIDDNMGPPYWGPW
jgi:hypothetical protein